MSLQAFAPDVSSETAYVINRMLHKDPNQRYASYGELLDHFKYAIDTLNQNAAKPRVAKQRVVVESESQVNVAGVLTLLLLILMVAGGILGFVFRDRLFGTASAKGEAPVNPQAAPADARLSPESLYDDARHQIVDEKYADAQEAFAGLAQRKDIPHPMLDWVKVHQGMTAILGHELSESRSVFTCIEAGGYVLQRDRSARTGEFLRGTRPQSRRRQAGPGQHDQKLERQIVRGHGPVPFRPEGLGDRAILTARINSSRPISTANRPPRISGSATTSPSRASASTITMLYAALRAKRNAPGADPAALRAEYTKARSELQTTGKMVEAFFAAEADLSGGNAPVGVAAAPGHASPSSTATAAR